MIKETNLSNLTQEEDESRVWLNDSVDRHLHGEGAVKLLGRKEALREYVRAEGNHYEKLKAVQRAVLRHNGLRAI
jgi:hypothetical protein